MINYAKAAKLLLVTLVVLFFLLIPIGSVLADSVEVLKGHEDLDPAAGYKVIPYAFYNETADFAAAFALISGGMLQPQTKTVVNAFYSTNNSYNIFFYVQDIRSFLSDRLFIDVWGVFGEWGLVESYLDGNPEYPDERAGSNDSNEDNFIESEGSDNQFHVKFRYLLPIGHGCGDPIHTYVMDENRLLVAGSESGGISWNPFCSGRTFLGFELFTRQQDLEDDRGNNFKLKTTAFTFDIEYNNTDYEKNPTFGSKLRLALSHDWGMHDDNGNKWTTIEAEYSKFFNLGATEKSLQRVLAFDAWWIDTPSWNDSSTKDGKEVYHRPPLFAGAQLGGLFRQRAYPAARFNDRCAVNYTLEYRCMPKWNPFPKIPLVNKLQIPWWQWSVFSDLGRVHDEWEFDELHKDMKYSIGAGIRLLVEGAVIRVDVAVSEEDIGVQMFVNHTF